MLDWNFSSTADVLVGLAVFLVVAMVAVALA